MFGKFFGQAQQGQAAHPGFGVPGSGTNPQTLNPGQAGGVLTQDSGAQNRAAGIPYVQSAVFPPTVPEALDGQMKYRARFRTVVFGGSGISANTIATQAVPFSVPTVVVARTAAAWRADDVALPVGRNALDTFKVQMFTTGQLQDLLDAGAGGSTTTSPTVRVAGSAVLGTGALPGLIPKNGAYFDNGYFLSISVETLIISIEVHITLWCVEEIGPARMP